MVSDGFYYSLHITMLYNDNQLLQRCTHILYMADDNGYDGNYINSIIDLTNTVRWSFLHRDIVLN